MKSTPCLRLNLVSSSLWFLSGAPPQKNDTETTMKIKETLEVFYSVNPTPRRWQVHLFGTRTKAIGCTFPFFLYLGLFPPSSHNHATSRNQDCFRDFTAWHMTTNQTKEEDNNNPRSRLSSSLCSFAQPVNVRVAHSELGLGPLKYTLLNNPQPAKNYLHHLGHTIDEINLDTEPDLPPAMIEGGLAILSLVVNDQILPNLKLRMSNKLRFHVRLPYDGSPATANEEEQTRQRLQPDAAYFYTKCLLGRLHRLLSQDVTLHCLHC